MQLACTRIEVDVWAALNGEQLRSFENLFLEIWYYKIPKIWRFMNIFKNVFENLRNNSDYS